MTWHGGIGPKPEKVPLSFSPSCLKTKIILSGSLLASGRLLFGIYCRPHVPVRLTSPAPAPTGVRPKPGRNTINKSATANWRLIKFLLTNTLPMPWRQPRLLLADRDQRVYVGRPPRRDKTREQRHRQQQNWGADKCHRISWRDAEKLTLKQACGGKRRREPETNPEQSQDQSLLQHHAQDGARPCAERYANANLARALADGVGQDAVQTDRRQQQRQQSEETGKRADQPLLRQRFVNLPGERLDIVERQVGVNFTRRLPDGADDEGGINEMFCCRSACCLSGDHNSISSPTS